MTVEFCKQEGQDCHPASQPGVGNHVSVQWWCLWQPLFSCEFSSCLPSSTLGTLEASEYLNLSWRWQMLFMTLPYLRHFALPIHIHYKIYSSRKYHALGLLLLAKEGEPVTRDRGSRFPVQMLDSCLHATENKWNKFLSVRYVLGRPLSERLGLSCAHFKVGILLII